METLISLIVAVVLLAAQWIIYKKMGHEGWEGIVPIYNTYVLCKDIFGNGWKFLLLLVPIYNIIFTFKIYIGWAHGFNKSTGFGVGLVFLTPIFEIILAFNKNIVWGDGSQANTDEDFVSRTTEKVAGAVKSEPAKDDQALDKLKELNELKEQGIITEEEFEAKKAELMKRI